MTVNESDFLAPTSGQISLSDYATNVDIFPSKSAAKSHIKDNAKDISDLCHRLYGERAQSLLIVLQGMDTSGKDGTTEALFHRTPPLNVKVAPFKAPTKTELSQDYLWRVHQVCPAKGEIVVFNRSHYEDVLVVKVRNFAPAEAIELRYEQINNFEKHLVQNGTKILKFMLHISPETQKERLQDRLDNPNKRWKFNPGDLDDRALWPDFMQAYQTMLNRTSTEHAPWHIIPSDNRKTRGAIITSIVRETLISMNPTYPATDFKPEDYTIV